MTVKCGRWSIKTYMLQRGSYRRTYWDSPADLMLPGLSTAAGGYDEIDAARPGSGTGGFLHCAVFGGMGFKVNAYSPKNSASTSSQLSTASSSAPVRLLRLAAATACSPNTSAKLPRNSRTAATVTSSSGSKEPSS